MPQVDLGGDSSVRLMERRCREGGVAQEVGMEAGESWSGGRESESGMGI